MKRKMLGTHVSGATYGKYVDLYDERVKAYEVAARTSGAVRPAGDSPKMKTKHIELPMGEIKDPAAIILKPTPDD